MPAFADFRYHGRKRVMMYSGLLFMIAAIILCAAEHISMIIIGRVFQGIAVRCCLSYILACCKAMAVAGLPVMDATAPDIAYWRSLRHCCCAVWLSSAYVQTEADST